MTRRTDETPRRTPVESCRPMITVAGLMKRYGDRVVVDDVTFEVAAGHVTGFVGPNGAGKSTTMRAMVGLTRPDRGEVRYHGIRYDDLKHPTRIVGSVLDPRCMHPGRTARNHLRATAAASGVAVDRADEVLAEVGLDGAADRRAGGFSLGMRQRVALAGALLGDPQVLLLDEPANGLDPDGIRWLRSYLPPSPIGAARFSVSSHLIGELERFVDDVIVLGGGRLIGAGSVESITARDERAVVVETPHASGSSSCSPTLVSLSTWTRTAPPAGPGDHSGGGVAIGLRPRATGDRDHRVRVVVGGRTDRDDPHGGRVLRPPGRFPHDHTKGPTMTNTSSTLPTTPTVAHSATTATARSRRERTRVDTDRPAR